jgi:hypothetical protein
VRSRGPGAIPADLQLARLGHYAPGRHRWQGIGIYALVRIAILLASGHSDIPGISTAAILAGVFVTLPLMAGVALLGARRPGVPKPASTPGYTCTGCRRRIGLRRWRCLTRLLPPDAAELAVTKASLI